MKLLSRFLILCPLFYFATSQVLNLKMSDNILGRSNTRLRASQSKLASAMFSFAENVRNTSKSASVSAQRKVKSTFSRLSMALAELAELAENLQTISSHDVFQNSSTDCDDINLKIIKIESNLRQYEALDGQAKVNRSLLQVYMSSVSNFARIEKSTLNLTSLTNQVKLIVGNYLEYIKNINESMKAEATAKANFENYRRGKCVCVAEKGISGSTQISTAIKTISDADNSLKTIQATIKSGITSASTQIAAGIKTNISDYDNFNLLQLQSHLRRVSTCSDLTTNLTSPTSCRELLDIVGRAQFRAWFVVQNGNIVRRNSTIVEKYLTNLNRTLTSSTTLSTSQRSSLTSVIATTSPILSAFKNHLSNSDIFNPKLIAAASELKTLSDNFCLCRSSESLTTSTLTTSTRTASTSTSTSTVPTTTSTTTSRTSTSSTSTVPRTTSPSTTSTSTVPRTTSTSTTSKPTQQPTITNTTLRPTTTSSTLTTTLQPSAPDLIEPNVYGALNTSTCSTVQSLLDSTGAYMKSACYIAKSFNQTDARRTCRAIGMELFAVQTDGHLRVLSNFTTTVFGTRIERVRIDGIYYNASQWLTYNPKRVPLLASIAPVFNSAMSGCVTLYYSSTIKIVQWGCEEFSNIFCEFIASPNVRQTTTTVLTTASTTMNTSTNNLTTVAPSFSTDLIGPNVYGALNASMCRSTHDIVDAAGVYIKTACYPNIGGNQTEARRLCRSLGMELFAVQSELHLRAIVNITTSIFGASSGAYIRIDGMYFNATTWLTYNPKKTAMAPNTFPQFNTAVSGCLCIAGLSTGYKIIQHGCERGLAIYCEFVKATNAAVLKG